MIVTNPFYFFHTQSSMDEDNELYLTNIVLFENIIIEAIHELSTSSVAGPDGIPSSLLVNCATELGPLLLIVFTHSLSSGVVPLGLSLQQLLLSLSQVTGQLQVITAHFTTFYIQ